MRKYYSYIIAVFAVFFVSCDQIRDRHLWNQVKNKDLECQMEILDVNMPGKFGDIFNALDASKYISIDSLDYVPDIQEGEGLKISRNGKFFNLPVRVNVFLVPDDKCYISSINFILLDNPRASVTDNKKSIENIWNKVHTFYRQDPSDPCSVIAAYTLFDTFQDGVVFSSYAP